MMETATATPMLLPTRMSVWVIAVPRATERSGRSITTAENTPPHISPDPTPPTPTPYSQSAKSLVSPASSASQPMPMSQSAPPGSTTLAAPNLSVSRPASHEPMAVHAKIGVESSPASRTS